jgi:hypothetical protein
VWSVSGDSSDGGNDKLHCDNTQRDTHPNDKTPQVECCSISPLLCWV